MIAIAVLSIGLLGIVSLTTRALSEEQDVADNFRASYLGAEGIEIARNIIDGNYLVPGNPWDQGFVCSGTCHVALDYASTDLSKACSSGDQLYFNASTGLYSLTTGNPTPFTRCVNITPLSANEIRISSVVSWTAHGNPLTVTVEDHFFNWRP